jgi:hypothetical protein
LVDQAKVKNFQVMRQYIGAVGAWLKAVTRKIGAGRTEFEFVLFYTFPGIANSGFYRTISLNSPATGAG